MLCPPIGLRSPPFAFPSHSCNEAADILIDWFGPDELKAVVGGERWWQVRGLDGIDGEWITQKDYLTDEKVHGPPGRKLSDDDETILRMEKLDRVMLYVHGGGYFWGSINLYLIRPPPNAVHKAIPPSKIVLAGDSAGGGLCLSTLAILRDMGLPMPAGAVLISPWVDLTHSFPSVMENTETDIIPQHGFLAKPSTLWPVNPLPTEDGRVGRTQNDPPPEVGHADQLKPNKVRVEEETKAAATPEDNETSTPSHLKNSDNR
ncbi:putative lipase esterase from carbohydrate esterase family ce10 [Mycena sanguinolenta]|uniref:Putative lipase esterase from carbohydrate esterase family ce10 n=1 Tax=Mycena sanguinolenta TaxID=230812 RepID=A0A8H7CYP4_9AGAR|nr:putative lipase esterase from carbohydrate esterase family ce10 [Mycena sanguinolenta]